MNKIRDFTDLIKVTAKPFPTVKIKELTKKRFTHFALLQIKEPYLKQAFPMKIEVSKRPVEWKENVDFVAHELKSQIVPLEAVGFVVTLERAFKDKKKMVKESEELLGAWANEDYGGSDFASIVFKPDGTYKGYADASGTSGMGDGTFTIEDKWTDSEKNIFYKVKINWIMGTQENIEFTLIKISDSGNIYEDVFDTRKYPTEIDPTNATYNIRSRL